MPPQVICFGELLIDFVSTQRDTSISAAPSFAKAPGGAPANVAVGLAKLGISTGFMGQVGNDPFGHYLADVLREQNIDVSGLRFSEEALTMLAFVAIEASGERSFVFYRKPSADMLMRESDLDKPLIAQAQVFHFGSITLISDPMRSTTLAALAHAQAHHLLISYDPNLRAALWPDLAAAKAGLLQGFDVAHVIKMSEEELAFLTDTPSIEDGIRQLWRPQTRLIAVTRGAEGCYIFTPNEQLQLPGYAVEVEDTIGAGDGFVAGLLAGLLALDADKQPWNRQSLLPVARQANAVGALTTTQRGAIPALPSRTMLAAFLKTQGA